MEGTSAITEQVKKYSELINRIIENINAIYKGKRNIIEYVAAGLISSNHILLNDLPGIGKTTLAKALAFSVSGTFKRIQFTPDLLPTDITGVNVYNQKLHEFQFVKGPVFANIILADEINRANQKVHSSLLECMSEQQVTIDVKTYSLDKPFFVIATQNPLEFQGTYRLPITVLDRFSMKLELGYPDETEEKQILQNSNDYQMIDNIKAVTSIKDIQNVTAFIEKNVKADNTILKYILDIIRRTRLNKYIRIGASPRSGIMLLNLAKALSLIRKRDFVIHDDIKELARHVLGHRIILQNRGDEISEIINDIISHIKVEF